MLEKLYTRFGKRRVWVFILVMIVIIAFVIQRGDESVDTETSRQLKVVELTSLRSLQTTGDISWLGTVRSVSDVTILSEADGVVTSVPVKLGDTVGAGTIIATLENGNERASLLQAEGAYEGALARARQGGVSLTEAERDLVDVINSGKIEKQNTLTTINSILATYLDQFYANEHSISPSLRISTPLPTAEVNAERLHFTNISQSWTSLDTSKSVAEIADELSEAKTEVERLLKLVDVFAEAVTMSKNSYTDAEIISLQGGLNTARTTLLSTIQTVDNTILNIKNAEDLLTKAKISSGSTGNTLNDAEVKQALGVLRQAQANYNKTIIRTPISGSINTLPVRPGVRISNLSEVAKVANNQSLEVVTYLSESDFDQIKSGDEVLLEGGVIGIVAIVSSAIDTRTGKLEARIALPKDADLVNGKSVKVSPKVSTETPIKPLLPLSSIRFKGNEAFLLTVSEGKVVEKPVTLGEPLGSQINLQSELDPDAKFIKDARGIQIGEEVIIKE